MSSESGGSSGGPGRGLLLYPVDSSDSSAPPLFGDEVLLSIVGQIPVQAPVRNFNEVFSSVRNIPAGYFDHTMNAILPAQG
jgi:hypothetical protein